LKRYEKKGEYELFLEATRLQGFLDRGCVLDFKADLIRDLVAEGNRKLGCFKVSTIYRKCYALGL
jgi:hypothetical protein